MVTIIFLEVVLLFYIPYFFLIFQFLHFWLLFIFSVDPSWSCTDSLYSSLQIKERCIHIRSWIWLDVFGPPLESHHPFSSDNRSYDSSLAVSVVGGSRSLTQLLNFNTISLMEHTDRKAVKIYTLTIMV